MGAISTPNLQLLTALASHCLLRSQHAVHSSRQQLQQLTEPLPAGFPPGPREYDLAWDLARDPLHCLESLRARYGDLVGFKLASRPIVLASSPSVYADSSCSPFFRLCREECCRDAVS
jgi:hypothetical protein